MTNSIFISPREIEYISNKESVLVEESGIQERVVVKMIKGANPSPVNKVLKKLKLANSVL